MRRPDVFTLDYSHPLAQGLLRAYFPVGGGVVDISSGAYVNWVVNPAMRFDRFVAQGSPVAKVQGITKLDYISVSADVASYYNPVTQSILVADKTFGTAARVFQARLESGGRAGFIAFNAGSLVTPVGTTVFNIGQRYSYCGTYDGTAAKVFVDGVQEASAALSGPLRQVIASAPVILCGYENSQDTYTARFDGEIHHVLLHNRALSPAEIALLADRTDPLLGGLIVEDRPVLYFDMGGSTEVEGPAVITAASTISASGSKQAISPATVTASASVGMGGIKGAVAPLNIVGSISVEASGIKSTSGPATFTAAAEYGASGIKTIIGLDKEGPAVITASATVGMGGVKGGVGAAVLGGDSAVETGGVKGVTGQAWFAAMGEFYASRGPDEVPITADEIGRAASLQARNYSAVLAKRNYTARL